MGAAPRAAPSAGTARGSGADTIFVLAVQVLRLFVMLFSARLVARWLGRSRPG